MVGMNLKKADEWMNRAIKMEGEGKGSMMDKCLDKAVKYEADGLAAGESWQ